MTLGVIDSMIRLISSIIEPVRWKLWTIETHRVEKMGLWNVMNRVHSKSLKPLSSTGNAP